MTNRKSTKRALLGSVMAMVLCLAMLIGATFAWFTDTASTGVNKIQAGNLDVQLVDENGNSLEGKTLEFKKALSPEKLFLNRYPDLKADYLPIARSILSHGERVRWA